MNKNRRLVVAYPKISDEHRNLIQELRSKYDQLSFRAIAPHFTLFFPCSEIDKVSLSTALIQNIKGVKAFSFSLGSAILMPPVDGGDYSYVFLIPNQGFSELVRLHDRIYSNVLDKFLRLDIPFIPHLTVANSKEITFCKKIVDQINAEPLSIDGRVETLSIIEERGDHLVTLEEINLS